MKKKGFTLIELLVVISIIALLLSILMPALSKVKEQAKFVICGSNIRQLGMAGIMYATVNEGLFPIALEFLNREDGTTGSAWCRWHNEEENISNRPEMAGTLWPYLENQDVVMCPTFKSLSRAAGKDHLFHDPDIPMDTQYAFSQNVFLGPLTDYEIYPHGSGNKPFYGVAWMDLAIQKKVSNVRQPSKIFFYTEEGYIGLNENNSPGYFSGLIDAAWSVTPLNDTGLFPYWGGANAIGNSDSSGSYHKTNVHNPDKLPRGVANAVFADGHVGILYPWETGKKSTSKIKVRELDHR